MSVTFSTRSLWILAALFGSSGCATTEQRPDDPSAATVQPDAGSLFASDSAPEAGSATHPQDGVGKDAMIATSDAGSPRADAQTSGDGNAGDDEYLGLAAPSQGFRIKTRGVEIPAQTDREYCEVSEIPGMPGQEYIVGAVDSANGHASHHLIVSTAKAGRPADKRLRTLEIGTQVPCVGAAIEFGEGFINLAGSQTSLAKAVYPDGVGLRVLGGQRIVFDYHYFNPGSNPVIAKAAVAVHTMRASEVRNIASTFAFTNMTIAGEITGEVRRKLS